MSEVKLTQEQPGKPSSFSICGCKGRVVATEDGKKHFEIDCKSKKDREEVASLFEEEAILRVSPQMILEDSPEPEVVIEAEVTKVK